MFDVMMQHNYGTQMSCTITCGPEKFITEIPWDDTMPKTLVKLQEWITSVFTELVTRLGDSSLMIDDLNTSINDLKRILYYIECGDIPITTEEEDGMVFIVGAIGKFVEHLADFHLIDSGGRVNVANQRFLTQSGYRVFPLDQDSFGWLLGGIRTPKGIISFG